MIQLVVADAMQPHRCGGRHHETERGAQRPAVGKRRRQAPLGDRYARSDRFVRTKPQVALGSSRGARVCHVLWRSDRRPWGFLSASSNSTDPNFRSFARMAHAGNPWVGADDWVPAFAGTSGSRAGPNSIRSEPALKRPEHAAEHDNCDERENGADDADHDDVEVAFAMVSRRPRAASPRRRCAAGCRACRS